MFRGKGYLPLALVQFSRGCRFECTFCAVSAYFHKTHYVRAIAEVVAEIKSQPRRLIFFVDDNMLCNRESAKALCRALIPLRMHWVSQASIDMTEDRELMQLMAESGCLGHVVGFESLDVENLHESRKTPNLITGRNAITARSCRSCASTGSNCGRRSRSATITTRRSRSRGRWNLPLRTSSALRPSTSSCHTRGTPLYEIAARGGTPAVRRQVVVAPGLSLQLRRLPPQADVARRIDGGVFSGAPTLQQRGVYPAPSARLANQSAEPVSLGTLLAL